MADHARRELPEEYGGLGLPAEEFQRHIAYDIGVEAVTRELAALLGAPAVLANFSRLLIDPNRGEDDPTLIRQLYDGTIVPGNYPMAAEERERRLDRFLPALSRRRRRDDRLGGTGVRARRPSSSPSIPSRRSCRARARPWHVGVLWDLRRPGGAAADRHAGGGRERWSSATTSPMTARCAATPCSGTPSSTALPMR